MAAAVLQPTAIQQTGTNAIPTLNSVIPGLTGMTNSATSNITDLLSGNVSPSIARNANAYFGIGAGQPASGGVGTFIGNRGADLYNTQANAAKQTGLGDLLNLINGYSGTVGTTAGQQLQNQQFNQNLGQNAHQFDQTNALNQFNSMISAISQLGNLKNVLNQNPFSNVTPNFSF